MRYFIRVMSLILLILCSESSFAKEMLHITVSGVTGDVLQNVQDSLAVEQKRYNKQQPTVENRQRLYHDAPNIIQQAVKPYGYFHAKVQSSLSYQANEWVADFRVIPGPLLYVTDLDIKVIGPGQFNPEIQKFIHHFPIKSGDVLLTKSYEDAKNAFFQVVNNQGYVKAILIKKELRIDLARNTAVIVLHMDTGPRYYFGALNFSDSPFATSFLNRFAEFQPGDPFSPQKVLKFQQDLESSHYFREASVTPDFNAAENSQIPTQVKLTAYKAKQYKLGVGYGTFTGPRLLAGVDWRHIGDSGQHFTALAKLSPVLRGLAVKYFIPGTKPLTDQYTLGANIQEFRPQNGNSFSESINGGYATKIGNFQHSISLNLLNERYTFNNQPRRNSHELYPSYTISHIMMDNMVDPHSGRMINFTVQGASENVFSTTSFFQSEIKAKFIFSPNADSRIITRGDLGYTIVNDVYQLPLTLQYLAGGPGSVRGFNLGSIGPGRYLEVASAEYQHRIIDNLYGAIFYDVGTATKHFNTNIQRGDGFGFVYSSPIGPVQLYLARAESKPWKPKMIIFNIGVDF